MKKLLKRLTKPLFELGSVSNNPFVKAVFSCYFTCKSIMFLRSDPLRYYFDVLTNFDFNNSELVLDRNHSLFLFGTIVSKKPNTVLEIGVGTGVTTKTILSALRYNGKGTLTSVDNWYAFGGKEPFFVEEFRKDGVKILAPIDEKEFVTTCASNAYDVVVSDADHDHAEQWLDDTLRIVRKGGFIFFHDTLRNKNLSVITKKISKSKHFYYHFTENSRPDERCDRGWLCVIKR